MNTFTPSPAPPFSQNYTLFYCHAVTDTFLLFICNLYAVNYNLHLKLFCIICSVQLCYSCYFIFMYLYHFKQGYDFNWWSEWKTCIVYVCLFCYDFDHKTDVSRLFLFIQFCIYCNKFYIEQEIDNVCKWN